MKNEIYKNKEWLKNKYIKEQYGSSYIAKYCGVDDGTIVYYLKKYNIPIRSRSESCKITRAKKYEINENYFEVIDNERKAYWLGFLMADGTMREHKTGCFQLSFELCEDDRYIIEQFNYDINSTYQIQINSCQNSLKNRARLIITNYNFCNHLIKHGIVPNKTGKEKIPESIPDKYTRDFIRGFFDGDGYVMFNNKSRVRGKFHIVSCSHKILYDLSQIIPADFTNKSLHLKSGTDHIYELETSNLVNLAKIYDYLYYDNCLCLERKENKFKEFLIYFKQSKRLTKRYSPIH